MNLSNRTPIPALYLILGLILALFSACADSRTSTKGEDSPSGTESGMDHPDSLAMQFRLEPSMAIGYASTYLLIAEEITYGQIAADSFILTVMAGAMNRDDWFAAHCSPDLLEAGFRRLQDTVPNRTNPFNGFVGPDHYPFELCVVRCLNCRDMRQPELNYRNGRVFRGRVLTLPDGGQAYAYQDLDEPDSHLQYLQSLGYQGGGPSWAGIISGAMQTEHPGIAGRLDYDDESEGLRIYSSFPDDLQLIGETVAQLKMDTTFLLESIKIAESKGEME